MTSLARLQGRPRRGKWRTGRRERRSPRSLSELEPPEVNTTPASRAEGDALGLSLSSPGWGSGVGPEEADLALTRPGAGPRRAPGTPGAARWDPGPLRRLAGGGPATVRHLLAPAEACFRGEGRGPPERGANSGRSRSGGPSFLRRRPLSFPGELACCSLSAEEADHPPFSSLSLPAEY